MSGQKGKTIITAALPYANNDLHVGHIASTYLPADILYRYLKLNGREAIQVCASDDFGTPILIAAEKAKTKPSEYVEVWNKRFREDLSGLGIDYDLFDRTSSAENVELVQEFFRRLNENGYIFESDIDQFYCNNDRKFLPDRYVKGTCPYCGAKDQYSDGCENCGRTIRPGEILEPRCAICGAPPVMKKSRHYFFKLSAFSDRLRGWLTENENLQSDSKNYVLNWIKDGLQDWDITRDIDWGVPIPLKEAEGKVLYGWFDNHLCYIATALKAVKKTGEAGKKYWNDSTIYHFIGKDIVYHHYLFLPSMRMGEGSYRLPDFIPTRGHVLLQGRKISKSRHWMITVRDFRGVFPPDYLRYYLARIVPFGQTDCDFAWEDFRDKINNELVASIGNFAYRTLVFVKTKHGGVVPTPEKRGVAEEEMERETAAAAKGVSDLIEQGHFDRALKRVLDFSSSCNQYFQHKAPWENSNDEPATMHQSCALAASISVLLNPFLPFSSESLWRQLGMQGTVQERGWAFAGRPSISPGQKIGDVSPLFKKIEKEEMQAAEELVR
ncbi:MAG TPA: methionine--tRNA ligase [Nitrososphaerales archaeon]|nr:methionine--tRNA ligase [Nitrososphaerales archaeon]